MISYQFCRLCVRYGPEVSLGNDVDWSAKYFYDDPCIRYAAIDPKKRGVQVGSLLKRGVFTVQVGSLLKIRLC